MMLLQLACTDALWRRKLWGSPFREGPTSAWTRWMKRTDDQGNQDVEIPVEDHWHKNPASVSIIHILLRYGADASLTGGKAGQTVLHVAARAGNPHIIAALLDSSPALLYALDAKQRLPLHHAFRWAKATRILLDRHDQTVRSGTAVEGSERIAFANAPDELGNTPLHYAALGIGVGVVSLYLKIYQNDDIVARNKEGETAYDYAVDEYQSSMKKFRKRVPGITTSMTVEEIGRRWMENETYNILKALYRNFSKGLPDGGPLQRFPYRNTVFVWTSFGY